MAYCLPTWPQFYCKFKFVLPSTCPHHCQEICQSSCPAHCCASQHVSTMEHSQSIQELCPTICSSSWLPSCPFFAVRCLRRCQAHVQAVALWAAFCHANDIVVKSTILLIFRQSPATCPSPIAMCNSLWRHVPSTLFSSVLLRTIVIFNKINTNRKCSAKLFAAPKLCNSYTICPSFSPYYCSHSWLQYCCIGRQKSPYLFETPVGL